ncbi:2-C-methyl-D-erythritol 2,4-cyclodiphosphate synthase [Candidatus Acetothermia bacterium]|nr:2-C-methyl-D-erythritol 2,4-cyclodiphosphate synthase [Candidatus Acetothermia bacterium]MCI2427040.1 2-C-methyl-D-erythritol 2,4-cyclodiphosphate synthase [Candidatus Acetothermia bacterium]MCI2428257.1 2-C-methyl-D-erythritol 2,4-cyclodiphosphate synthase [Candidatus Acetothermia bacterium]
MRIGIGIDFHRLIPGRALIIGGVQIPYPTGLAGHSDADVLIHSICDGLLGAAGLNDIGHHFPSSDERYQNISSLILLRDVAKLIAAKGYSVVNIDSCIIAEKPQLASYFDAMKSQIAPLVNVAPEMINIKATTPEGMGALGRQEGIAAHSACLIEKRTA